MERHSRSCKYVIGKKQNHHHDITNNVLFCTCTHRMIATLEELLMTFINSWKWQIILTWVLIQCGCWCKGTKKLFLIPYTQDGKKQCVVWDENLLPQSESPRYLREAVHKYHHIEKQKRKRNERHCGISRHVDHLC